MPGYKCPVCGITYDDPDDAVHCYCHPQGGRQDPDDIVVPVDDEPPYIFIFDPEDY